MLGGKRKFYYFDTQKEEYFFDRDPDIFPHILNFYRSGALHYPSNECVELFESELKFFGIFPSSLALCCVENFENSKSKTERYCLEKCKMRLTKALRARRLEEIAKFKEKLWFIFEEPALSTPGLAVWVLTVVFVLTTVVSLIMETVPKDSSTWGTQKKNHFNILETICVTYFTVEYILRLYCSPNRWIFVRQFTNIIDVISILPFYFGLILGSHSNIKMLAMLRVLRITRIGRVSRFFVDKIEKHGSLLKQNKDELKPLILCFVTVLVLFSTIMYYGEKDNSGFLSIPACFWYTIVTMTSLG